MTSARSRSPDLYDTAAIAAANQVVDQSISDFLSRPGTQRGVTVTAPAGAGKSGLVCTAVGRARGAGLHVAVGTPTNEQAFGLVRRLAEQYPSEIITFVPAQGITLPPATQALPNVRVLSAADSNGQGVIVGTLSKLGDAFTREALHPVDVLLIDEAYQANAAQYYAVGGLAPMHMLVGDGGQISPFSTIEEPARWRGLPEDPLQTSVGVLRRNHPLTPMYALPISRRLDARAVPVVRAFYPGLHFDAAVLSGVRQLTLMPAVATDRRLRAVDRSLELAASGGWAHLELPEAAVLTADQEMIGLVVTMVERLFQRGAHVSCERALVRQPLAPSRVAVGVSHNDQKDFLRLQLTTAGYPNVVVDTANKLQGLEFDVVIAWHPLAGLMEPDGFHLDPGRLCVLLTRHRQACILLGRAGDRRLLDSIPPGTPAFLGWDPDPVLDGWEIHQSVFSALEPFRVDT